MITLARALRRHEYLMQPILQQMQVAIILIGSLFWIEARMQGDAFSAAVFGKFAVTFPAEMWAGVMMGASALCWIGLRHPVKRWMVAVGAALQTLQYLALGYSAIATGGEMVIGLHCTTFFAPIYMVMLCEALRNDAD
mgnify:FL=1